jgi:hypothetical protein
VSSSGNGKDAPPGKPGATGDDGGMAVIRKQRRASLEKALRGGTAARPEPERPDAAAAWGGVLQREARGAPASASDPPKAESPSKAPAATSPGPADPPKAESPSPRTAPATTGSLPRVPATTGSLPRVPATTGGLPRVGGLPAAKPSTPLPNVTAVRAPSTAQPDEVFEPPEARLNREAGRLADAHEIRESRTRFSMVSVAQIVRSVLALMLVVACALMAVLPAVSVVERARHLSNLTNVLGALAAEIEREPGLSAALTERDLPRLRELFLRRRAEAAERLRAAGFSQATEETLRVRLTDAGKAIALSAEFTEADGEVLAATVKTGARGTPPAVPALTEVLFGEFLLPTLALVFTAVAAVAGLVFWPWWRGRRAA